MADVQKAIEVIFSGTDDSLGSTVAKLGSGVNSFAGDLQSVTQPLANMGTDILKLEAALVALTAGGLALATAKSGEFGDSFNEISTLIQAPTESIAKFKDGILDYSLKSTQSLESINAAVYAAISATGDWENSLDLLAVSEKLAVGGVTDLGSATQLLATTLNAYGADISEAANYSDTFFTIVKDGVTTIPQLTTTIANVTSLAASAGIPFEVLGAAIAAMTGYGVKTSETMTQLKQAIAAMLAPTDATRAAAEDLGVDMGKAAIESKGFEVVLREIYDAANGDLEIIKKIIPSIEGANAVLILGADAGDKFASSLKHQAENAGATEEAYKKMADNFSLINQNMANNFNAVLVLIGDKIIDKYLGVSGGVVDILTALSNEIKGGTFDGLFQAINEQGDLLIAKLEAIAKNLPAAFDSVRFDGLISSFQSLITAAQDMFQSFFGDIDLTSAEGLSTAIQKMVDSIQTLNEASQGIVEGLTPFIATAGFLLDKMNELDAGTVELIGNILGLAIGITPILGAVGAFGLAMEGGALAVGGISRAIGLAGGIGLTGAMGTLMATLGPLIALWATWEAAFKLGTSLYKNNTLGVKDAADATAEWVGKMLTGVDVQEGLNSVLNAGTDLTKEQIEAWKKRTQVMEETPTEITTRFGVEMAEGEKIFDFIIANSDVGMTAIEIMAKLKAEYADTETGKLIDWAQLDEEIKKWVGLEVEDPAKIQADLAAAVKANSEGIVSWPANFHVDVDKLLTDTEQAAIKVAEEWAKVGLDFNVEGVDEAVQKVKDATNRMAQAAGVSFDGIGGHMAAKFNEVTGAWETEWTAIQGSIPGSIAPAVEKEMEDLELAALKSKETIEKALELRASVKIEEFESQVEKMKIQAGLLEQAMQIQGEIDITNLENVGKAFDAITVGLQTSGDIISKAIGEMKGIGEEFGPFSRQMAAVLRSMEAETEGRKKEVELLGDLTEAQVAYLQAKTDALGSGDSILKVEADGLKPHLEAFMWEILGAIQIRSTESMDEFLLGLP